MIKGESHLLFRKKLLAWPVGVACALLSGAALGSGFALTEQGASGLGNAYAGGAAIADDASTIFSNPAGMANLSGTQIAVSLHAISPSVKYSGTTNGAPPLQTAGSGTGGDAGRQAWEPNVQFMTEINPDLKFGLSLTSPFGLQTSYDPGWMGRFQAIKTQLKTVNLNPAFSYRINDSVAVGAGLSYQQVRGELSSAVNYSAAAFAAGGAGALTAIGGTGKEGVFTLSGSDHAWGYNFGALFKLSPQTRVGLAYRSRVRQNLTGSITFTNRPALLSGPTALPDGPGNLPITMPDSFSASVFHRMDEKWDVMADATRTGWHVMQQLAVQRLGAGAAITPVPENWHDTWRISAGANYHYNQRWMARAGIAYDQSPVDDPYRTARSPDNDRTWLSVGGQYKPGKDSALDFAYAHIFVKNAPLNQTAATNTNLAASGAGYLLGSYKISADILSVQYTQHF